MAAVIQSEQMSALASDEQSQGRRIAIEFGIALLVVLLFFFIVFGIMNLYFPIGTSVKDLTQAIGTSVSPTGSKDLFIDGANNTQTMATVTELGNKVNVKSASTIAWSRAQLGMALANRDAMVWHCLARRAAVLLHRIRNYESVLPHRYEREGFDPGYRHIGVAHGLKGLVYRRSKQHTNHGDGHGAWQ